MKKKTRGRPALPRGQDRGSVLTVRFKPSERRQLERAARETEQTLSAWTREVLLSQAKGR